MIAWPLHIPPTSLKSPARGTTRAESARHVRARVALAVAWVFAGCADGGAASGDAGRVRGRDLARAPAYPVDAVFVDAKVDVAYWPVDAAPAVPDAAGRDALADGAPVPDARPSPDSAIDCRLNSDCPPGQYCGQFHCTFDCRENRDCAAGQRCVNGDCEDTATLPDAGVAPPPFDCRREGCPADDVCNGQTGRCEAPVGPPDGTLGAECVADADCHSNFCTGLAVVGEAHHFCSILCCSEGECPLGFGCGSGGGPRFCIPSSIFPGGAYTFDAAAGQSCGRGGGACQSMLCNAGEDRCLRTCCTNRDCGGASCVWQPAGDGQAQVCDINVLGFGSTGEACEWEYDCQSLVCIFGPNGPVCADMCCSNADCPPGTACQQVINPVGDYIMACGPSTRGAALQRAGCAGDAGCESGLCIRGQCEDTCCEDAHCPAGQHCTTTDNGENGSIRVCR